MRVFGVSLVLVHVSDARLFAGLGDVEQFGLKQGQGSDQALVAEANRVLDVVPVFGDDERLFRGAADVQVHVAVVDLQPLQDFGIIRVLDRIAVLVGKVGLTQQVKEDLRYVGTAEI